MTPRQRLTLDLLAALGESGGLDLVKSSGSKLRRGTVYVTLGILADRDLVDSREVEPRTADRAARRVFRITRRGKMAREGITEQGIVGTCPDYGQSWA